MRRFLCEPYLTRLRDETAESPEAREQVAHLWTLGLLEARFDTLLLPVLLPQSQDPEQHLISRGLPPDFVRERLANGACLILPAAPDPAVERRYPNCYFLLDAAQLLRCEKGESP